MSDETNVFMDPFLNIYTNPGEIAVANILVESFNENIVLQEQRRNAELIDMNNEKSADESEHGEVSNVEMLSQTAKNLTDIVQNCAFQNNSKSQPQNVNETEGWEEKRKNEKKKKLEKEVKAINIENTADESQQSEVSNVEMLQKEKCLEVNNKQPNVGVLCKETTVAHIDAQKHVNVVDEEEIRKPNKHIPSLEENEDAKEVFNKESGTVKDVKATRPPESVKTDETEVQHDAVMGNVLLTNKPNETCSTDGKQPHNEPRASEQNDSIVNTKKLSEGVNQAAKKSKDIVQNCALDDNVDSQTQVVKEMEGQEEQSEVKKEEQSEKEIMNNENTVDESGKSHQSNDEMLQKKNGLEGNNEKPNVGDSCEGGTVTHTDQKHVKAVNEEENRKPNIHIPSQAENEKTKDVLKQESGTIKDFQTTKRPTSVKTDESEEQHDAVMENVLLTNESNETCPSDGKPPQNKPRTLEQNDSIVNTQKLIEEENHAAKKSKDIVQNCALLESQPQGVKEMEGREEQVEDEKEEKSEKEVTAINNENTADASEQSEQSNNEMLQKKNGLEGNKQPNVGDSCEGGTITHTDQKHVKAIDEKENKEPIIYIPRQAENENAKDVLNQKSRTIKATRPPESGKIDESEEQHNAVMGNVLLTNEPNETCSTDGKQPQNKPRALEHNDSIVNTQKLIEGVNQAARNSTDVVQNCALLESQSQGVKEIEGQKEEKTKKEVIALNNENTADESEQSEQSNNETLQKKNGLEGNNKQPKVGDPCEGATVTHTDQKHVKAINEEENRKPNIHIPSQADNEKAKDVFKQESGTIKDFQTTKHPTSVKTDESEDQHDAVTGNVLLTNEPNETCPSDGKPPQNKLGAMDHNDSIVNTQNLIEGVNQAARNSTDVVQNFALLESQPQDVKEIEGQKEEKSEKKVTDINNENTADESEQSEQSNDEMLQKKNGLEGNNKQPKVGDPCEGATVTHTDQKHFKTVNEEENRKPNIHIPSQAENEKAKDVFNHESGTLKDTKATRPPESGKINKSEEQHNAVMENVVLARKPIETCSTHAKQSQNILEASEQNESIIKTQKPIEGVNQAAKKSPDDANDEEHCNAKGNICLESDITKDEHTKPEKQQDIVEHIYEVPDVLLNNSAENIQETQQVRGKKKNLDNVTLSIAVTGSTGAGKSSFINAIRGLKPDDDNAAPTGVTETTMTPTMYIHPTMPNVHFWDLPGTGSPKFRAKKYLKTVKLDSYDFFIIISSGRFKENDILLAKAIKEKKKLFYFLRSKIDNDIQAESPKKDFDKQKVLSLIREDCQRNLKDMENSMVFLISSFELNKYDFQSLISTLEKQLPAHKRDALILSLPIYSSKILERKVETFSKQACSAAIASGSVAVAPVPGLSIACNAAILLSFFTKCYYAFGLDDESIEKLSERVNDPSLKAVRSSPLVVAIGQKKLSNEVLAALTSKEAAVKFAWSMIPVVGSKKAAEMSYAATLNLLQAGLQDLADTARKVLKVAGLADIY